MALVALMMTYEDVVYNDSGEIISKATKTMLMESIEDTRVDGSSELTTHPIVSGDMVADHMIKNPISFSIDGELSMNGSTNVTIDGTKPSLKEFEDEIEKIKNRAYLCNVSKITLSTQESRFLQRSNMVITSFSFSEKVNLLKFSINMTQAMLAEVQEYDVDLQDENLPAITDPATLSFSSTLMDWDQIDKLVIDTCATLGLTTDEFMNYLKSYRNSVLIGSGIAGMAILITYIAACASIPVGGWVVGAVSLALAGVAILYYGIYSAIKSAVNSRKFRIEQFKKYKDDRESQKEVERFANFVGSIHEQLMTLNDTFYVYQISSNEPQECMLTIDDNYYIFAFEKNNTNGQWFVNVTLPTENDRVYSANKSLSCAKTSYAECNSNNALFRAIGSGAYVYLMYVRNEDYEKDDLRNYYILVSGIKPEEFNDAVTDIIKNAILY